MPLPATLPDMAEPINFAWLHGQDHLSDYTLVLEARDPAVPAEPPDNGAAAAAAAASQQPLSATVPLSIAPLVATTPVTDTPATAAAATAAPASKPDKRGSSAAAHKQPADKKSAASGLPKPLQNSDPASSAQDNGAADAAARNAGGASCSYAADAPMAPPTRRVTRALKRQRREAADTANDPSDVAAPSDPPKSGGTRKAGSSTPAASAAPPAKPTAAGARIAALLHGIPSPAPERTADHSREAMRAFYDAPGINWSGVDTRPWSQQRQEPEGRQQQQQQQAQQQRRLSSRRVLVQRPGQQASTAGPSSGQEDVLDDPQPNEQTIAAAVQPGGMQQGAHVRRIEIPAHGVVLSVMSDYFRAIIEKWNGDEKRIVVQVAPDELDTAAALVAFMYTGSLPALSQEDMLTLMKLADRYQVKNCPAACARKFVDTPCNELQLETVAAIFEWPAFLQESASEPFSGVLAKAAAKLMDVFGDLEAAWRDDATRKSFLKLPFKAVKHLVESDDLRCYSENTVLCAVGSWLEANTPAWRYWQQHTQIAELVRLQHLSPCFLGSVVKKLSCMSCALTGESMALTSRYAASNEATRAKLHTLATKQGRQKVLLSPPRASSDTGRLQFEWHLELKEVRDMISQFKASRVTTDRYSECHFFNGFDWQFVLQVLEPPAKASNAANASPTPTVDVFVGATAKVRIGSSTFLPDVVYFHGAIAARELSTGDFTFENRIESGFVCSTAGWGFRNFLRIVDWDNEEMCRRFFYDGKLHLRCVVEHCE